MLASPILLATLLFSPSAHSQQLGEFLPPPKAIIHGRAEPAGSAIARSTVLLIPDDQEGHSCSGTLIAPDLVVTAAHCVVKDNTNQPLAPQQILVNFTTYFDGGRTEGQPLGYVRGIRKHPDYDDKEAEEAGNPHDIALLRLTRPAPKGYVPAAILPSSEPLTIGTSVVVAGYGDSGPNSDDSDYRLRSFPFRLSEFRNESLVTLTADQYGGVGNGDSGGPAFAQRNGQLYLFGVCSSSEENGAPAWYENLLHYRAWLEANARELGVDWKMP